MIIDCHTHLLPGIDDGAKDLGVSMEMLKEEHRQGIDLVIASPHFYANRDQIENFIDRRAKALEIIKEHIALRQQSIPTESESPQSATAENNSLQSATAENESPQSATVENDSKADLNESNLPEIKLGAEVAFFNGISKSDEIGRLCVEGTSTLLIEMPFDSWSDKVINEINELVTERGFSVVLVHIERFLSFPGNTEKVERLLGIPVILQMNAERLIQTGIFGKMSSKKLLEYIETGMVSLLGSDCHNMGTRKPNLLSAREMISKEALQRIDEAGQKLFG